MGFCRSSCRCATEFLSSILLTCAAALLAFGGVLLYKWRSDDVTKLQPPPHYILLLLLFGGLLFAANALAFAGACYRTRCMLGAATCINFALLLAQLSLAIVIFADPSAIDQQVCPPDDVACLEKLDNLFKEPQAHAGLVLALVCGIQAVALCSASCLKDLQARKDARDDEEESALDRPLREEDWQEREEEIERKARRKLELHKAALSTTARAAIEKRDSPSRALLFGRSSVQSGDRA